MQQSLERGDAIDDAVVEWGSCKCVIMTLCLFILVILAVECADAYFIYDNDHFDPVYFDVYVAILCIYFAALVLACIYLFSKESPSTRIFVPWTFLVTAIASTLLVVWIIVYVGFIYQDDYVYVKKSETVSGTEGS